MFTSFARLCLVALVGKAVGDLAFSHQYGGAEPAKK